MAVPIIETDRLAHMPAGFLQLAQVLSLALPDNDAGLVGGARQIAQHLPGRRMERNDPGAALKGLVTLQDEPRIRQIHAVPFKRRNRAELRNRLAQERYGRSYS